MLRHLASAIISCGFATAQSPLTPPFGLRWGDSPETFLSWAEKHALDVTITLPAAEPALRILRASSVKGPLPGSLASALEGRFLKGRLFEVTEHHFDHALPSELLEARFEDTRKRLAQECGPLLLNRRERTVADQIVTSVRAYHRESIKGLVILLCHTELEDLARQSRTSRFSVIYRNENLRMDLVMTQR